MEKCFVNSTKSRVKLLYSIQLQELSLQRSSRDSLFIQKLGVLQVGCSKTGLVVRDEPGKGGGVGRDEYMSI